MNLVETERQSLLDLKEIESKAKEWRISLVLIGGYAIRAYTKTRRYTKDLDFVTEKRSLGKFKGLLKDLGYAYTMRQHWMTGNKKGIRLNIVVGNVHDIQTKKDFPAKEQFFKDAKLMDVTPLYPENKGCGVKAKVCSIEDLLIMKLIPLRNKDLVDACSILLDCYDSINLKKLSKKAREAGLLGHMKSRLEYIATQNKKRQLNKKWKSLPETTTAMTAAETRELNKKLKALHKGL